MSGSQEFFGAIVSIGTAIVGVAIISTLVSKNSQTPQVLSAAGNAFSGALSVAVSPVTGGVANLGQSLSIGGLSNEFN